jgi:transposase-like protein/DNA-directed RNA polymerase subunit RPC12/RpoP
MTIIPKIKCPRCNSFELYKYGKDIHGYQKYQCKVCKRQFAPFSPKSPRKSKGYPKCPKCGKATFIHHDYKHYTQYRCGDKKCNHAFYLVKPNTVGDASCQNLFGKTNFKRMRFPLHVIITALNLFYLCNASTRKISQFLLINNGIKVSHVAIASWAKKFAPLFQNIASKLENSINLNSDEWHADETVVKINGKKYYIWFVIDSETRFVISFHLSPYRSSPQSFKLFANARKHGTPECIVTDRYWSYDVPVKALFPSSRHIKVQSFKDDISNNIIESFNDTFKSWYRPKRGFGSFKSANNLIATFIFFYNFIRPHSSLNNLTPAQVAGANYNDRDRCNWLLTA